MGANMAFKPGETVAIHCDIQPGPFPGEFLVTVQTAQGPISGFVRQDQLVELGGNKQLRGVVKETETDHLLVWLHGSFFTTTGLADLSREWARSNVQSLAAA